MPADSQKPVRILHFADAHIDIANWGKHDPETGLPVRVVDFLRALDHIVEAALAQKVDLVLFAGDAYKDRNPQPTFQREWGKRMMRLSAAGIPTVLLVGNHDVSPAAGRAHTLQEFETLGVKHIHIADDFAFLGPEELGVPVQIITIPWVSRSKMLRREDMSNRRTEDVFTEIESIIVDWVDRQIEGADPNLPLILMAHASVQGAIYGTERMVMLGQELVLGGSIVRDKRLDYVALGHIHKHQDLSGGSQPPVVYPGSIERIDFGEVNEDKGYVLVELRKGQADWQFVRLPTRRFLDIRAEPDNPDTFMEQIMAQLPPKERLVDAVCRVRLTYPHDWEALLDEAALYHYFEGALSLQIQKHREVTRRARLGDTAAVETLPYDELLALYWDTVGLDGEETAELQKLAHTLFEHVNL